MYSYLALGDSYTVGEQVPLNNNFPYQTVQQLRSSGINIFAPEIIARTGWTTDELSEGISSCKLPDHYDFVSLLIGVNNQYRGRSGQEFKEQFEQIVRFAILKVTDPENVFILSIPDWGATPFAKEQDRVKIAENINQFNTICKEVAELNHCNFIEITESYRADVVHSEFLADDSLHPSAVEYEKWAKLLSKAMLNSIEKR